MLLNCGVGEALEGPLNCKEIKPDNPKQNQSWIFIKRTDDEAEVPILWPPDAKNRLLRKDIDAGKDWRQEEKGTTEDEMVGWNHRLDGHEFEKAPGIGDRQGSLVCCSPWGHKMLDMTEGLNWAEKTCTQKIIRHWWNKLKTIQTNGKFYLSYWLEELILLKWLYHPKQFINSTQNLYGNAKTLNSQSNVEKEEKSWRYHPLWFQTILQDDYNQNHMLLALKQTHRWLEQNTEPRNKLIHMSAINLQQKRQEYIMGKRQTLS